MEEFIKAVQEAKIPTILIVGGIVFLLLAIGAQIQFIAGRVNQKLAGGIGVFLLLAGLALALPVRVTNGPPSPTSTAIAAIIPTPTPTPICVMENFESGRQMDWFSPDREVFTYRETSEQAHSGTQSFKVKYNKTDTYQFIGAELPPGFCDFAKGQTLQVWVYGEVTLLLKLEDQTRKGVDISEQRATDPDGWTHLTFNYTNAEKTIDLGKIRIVLLFPAPDDASASGEFFLDDIAVFP